MNPSGCEPPAPLPLRSACTRVRSHADAVLPCAATSRSDRRAVLVVRLPGAQARHRAVPAQPTGSCAWVVCLTGLMACAAATPPSPTRALATLTKAMERRDVATVAELVSARDRNRLGARRLDALLSQLRPELGPLGEAVATAPRPQIRASLLYASGHRVPLVWESGDYRLRDWTGATLAAGTPRKALSALALALQGSQPLAATALLANSLRVQLQDGVQRWILDLNSPQTISLAADGRSARAVLRSGREIRLLQKAGVWWVSGID